MMLMMKAGLAISIHKPPRAATHEAHDARYTHVLGSVSLGRAGTFRKALKKQEWVAAVERPYVLLPRTMETGTTTSRTLTAISWPAQPQE